MIYDYAIVGAGFAGMLTAAVLCKNKKKVVVLEQSSKEGGYFNEVFSGVPFGAHHIGVPDFSLIEKYGEELNLCFDSHIIGADSVSVIVNGQKYELSLKLSKQEKQLIDYFPDEEKSIALYMEYMNGFSRGLYSNDDKIVKKYFMDLAMISFYDFLRRYFQNNELINLLTFLGPSYGGVNGEDSAFTFASLIATYGNGAYYFDMKWLMTELKEVILSTEASSIRCGFRCNRIEHVEKNNSYRIFDVKEDSVQAHSVVFASYFVDILKEYCETNKISNKILDKIFGMEVGASAYRFYYKLPLSFGRHEWIMLDQNEAIVSSLESEYANIMVTFVSNQSNEEDDLKERAFRMIKQLFPVEEKYIKLVYVSSLEDKKQITQNPRGAVFGWKRDITNNMTANLIYGLDKVLKDIYVVGNWSATFGIFGALYTVDKFLQTQKA